MAVGGQSLRIKKCLSKLLPRDRIHLETIYFVKAGNGNCNDEKLGTHFAELYGSCLEQSCFNTKVEQTKLYKTLIYQICQK